MFRDCGAFDVSLSPLSSKMGRFNFYGHLLLTTLMTLVYVTTGSDAVQKTKPLIVEMVFVVDNRNSVYYGTGTTAHVQQLVKRLNQIYAPLSIFILITSVIAWTDEDQINITANADQTLNNWLNYRKQHLPYNDNAQLLTAVEFESGVKGQSMIGTMCTYKFSGGVISDHHRIQPEVVATTMAHELAHAFGVNHDDMDECTCAVPNGHCIMSASASSNQAKEWSSCSKDEFKKAMARGMDTCLGKPKRAGTVSVCGNGLTEVGEQCDCGSSCAQNNCCTTECKMKSVYPRPVCASGECCDVQTCLWKKAGTECRAEKFQCDLPEYCNGTSDRCPPDVFMYNGKSCGDQAHCSEGKCGSKEAQCKVVWGERGTSNAAESCYDTNHEGSRGRHCGFNMSTEVYTPCADQDTGCGALQCVVQDPTLAVGYIRAAEVSTNVVSSAFEILFCRTVIVDFGLMDTNPGLVPDGASCGPDPDRMCVRQKCVALGTPCRCTAGGVCNSKGHCHCPKLQGGVDCSKPGLGGSSDSGPASELLKPRFTNRDVTQKARLHSESQLTCSAFGNPPPAVYWIRSDQNVTSRRPTGGAPDSTTAVLEFPRITEDDAGEYKCVAYNMAGRHTQIHTITVVQGPTILEGVTTQNLAVVTSSAGNLRCSATGIPTPTIQWSKYGSVTKTGITTNGNVSNMVSSILPFDDVRLEDAGVYMCNASNVAGWVEKQYRITVSDSTIRPTQPSTTQRTTAEASIRIDATNNNTSNTVQTSVHQQLTTILVSNILKMSLLTTSTEGNCWGGQSMIQNLTNNLTSEQLRTWDEILTDLRREELYNEVENFKKEITPIEQTNISQTIIEDFQLMGLCSVDKLNRLTVAERKVMVPSIVKGFLSSPQTLATIFNCSKRYASGVESLIAQSLESHPNTSIQLAYLVKAEFPRHPKYKELFPSSIRIMVWIEYDLCIRNKNTKEYLYPSMNQLRFQLNQTCRWTILQASGDQNYLLGYPGYAYTTWMIEFSNNSLSLTPQGLPELCAYPRNIFTCEWLIE